MRSDGSRRPRPAQVWLMFVTVSGGLLAGCSSSSGSGAAPAPSLVATASRLGSAVGAPTPSPTSAARELTVLVTNDDGVHAPGIDAMVQALRKESGVTLEVVAPATNQSGTGGKTSAGAVTFQHTTTVSGAAAVAVAGTPADSVNAAFSELHLQPDVVISGINAGQNLGPIVDFSGTVGAARAAARHGVPALAVSSGISGGYDFATASKYAIDWLRAERSALPATPSSTPANVVSLNVPSCPAGVVRGEKKLDRQVAFSSGQSALGASDCTSTGNPNTEVAAFTDGFATLVPLPLNPG